MLLPRADLQAFLLLRLANVRPQNVMNLRRADRPKLPKHIRFPVKMEMKLAICALASPPHKYELSRHGIVSLGCFFFIFHSLFDNIRHINYGSRVLLAAAFVLLLSSNRKQSLNENLVSEAACSFAATAFLYSAWKKFLIFLHSIQLALLSTSGFAKPWNCRAQHEANCRHCSKKMIGKNQKAHKSGVSLMS